MVRDVINAVQDTIANCSEQASKNSGSIISSGNNNNSMTDSRVIKAPLYIVDSLYALVIDGILPYQKNIVSLRSRYRLWNVVESSCNNGDFRWFLWVFSDIMGHILMYLLCSWIMLASSNSFLGHLEVPH